MAILAIYRSTNPTLVVGDFQFVAGWITFEDFTDLTTFRYALAQLPDLILNTITQVPIPGSGSGQTLDRIGFPHGNVILIPGPRGRSGTGVPVATVGGLGQQGYAAGVSADGRIAQSLLSAGRPYVNFTQVVFGNGDFPPASDNGSRSVGSRAPIQGVQTTADPDQFGAQFVMYGPGRGGWQNIFVNTPGTHPSDFTKTVIPGTAIVQNFYQGATGTGMTGHVAAYDVRVDGPQQPNTVGELPGRFNFGTGTGFAAAYSPGYYGVGTALALNSRQQAFVGGSTYHRLTLAGTRPYLGFGSNFGANLLIGPGGADPTQGPMKWDYAYSTLLTVPEPGVEEVDTTARRYVTYTDGIRRQYVTSRKIDAVNVNVNANATRTLSQGSDWFGIKLVVAGADIPIGAIARINLASPIADPGSVFMSVSVTSSYAGAVTAVGASVSLDGTSITVYGFTDVLHANETYNILIIYRRA